MTQIPNSRRITAFLNIEPGEERLISLLVLLYFILSLGVVFVQSMAFGVFIAEYGVQGLPYSYISIAFLASLVAVLYIRIGGRVSFARLLSINLIFLAVTTLLIWIVLNTPLYHAATFILPLWFQTAINLVNIAVWPLGGSLFDLRQGKRLFPLLGAGNWLANIVAGLFVPTLVKTIGTTNLLLLAVLSFGLSLFVLRAISRSYLQPKPNTPVAQSARPAKTPTAMFKDRYVRLIFVYITLWWAAFYFADNIFYDRAFAQFPDAAQLTAFIGQLLSIIGVVALLSSTVITGRVIARFGLRVGLIAMPLVVTATLGILAISGSLGASLLIVFALGAFAKLINVAFGFSLSQSANAIIYQSLPDSIRTRMQATAEGIVQPIAIGLAGLSLLALTAGLKFNYIGLAYVAVAVGAVWLIVIVLLSGNYVQALTRVITRRRLGDDAMVLADPASITILRDRLQDAHPGVVIYALNKLETLDGQAVVGELPKLVQHPAPDVRRDAFSRIETLKLRSALSDVQQQLLVEPDPSVKEAALRALGAITDNPAQFVHALSEMDTATQRGALIGLLKYGNEPIAQQKLDGLLAAASADHILAIEVLGAVNRREYHPQLISACDAPETSRAAGMALAAIGADILPEIETAFAQPDAPRERLLTLSRALGRIGGEHSQNILLSRMFTSDGDVRSQFINALSQSGYCTRDQAAIRRAINMEVQQAAWVSAAQVDLGETDQTALLVAALQQELVQIRNRSLMLLSFVFDGESIRRVREALLVGSPMQASYALEIMDAQLPTEWKAWVMPLLEEVDVSENETIFTQGDPGDSLYVIVDGNVRVHDGERLLNYLGERDVFGEMALLDPEPRLASVTAVEATRLFRLGQAPFYALIAERPEVATGIIRVLTGHLRNRVRDIAQLNARINELESGVRA